MLSLNICFDGLGVFWQHKFNMGVAKVQFNFKPERFIFSFWQHWLRQNVKTNVCMDPTTFIQSLVTKAWNIVQAIPENIILL
jgi:hypothetical protein